MTEELLDLVYKLKDSLSKDERIIKLNELEERMNNSFEVASLASKKEVASDDYNFALTHFANDSKEVEEAQKKLYEAKRELDLHPLVKEYMEQYKIVRDYYKEINNIIFSIINKDKCGGCCSK
ncbi:MAG: YlbF family regulator [Bacilli bacterium]|nr:YlbF family regulator [Bacilli bacterium]